MVSAKALLRDAVLRTLQAAAIAGMRAILLHASSESAKRFYVHCGFSESPLDPMTMMISVAEAEWTLSGKEHLNRHTLTDGHADASPRCHPVR